MRAELLQRTQVERFLADWGVVGDKNKAMAELLADWLGSAYAAGYKAACQDVKTEQLRLDL